MKLGKKIIKWVLYFLLIPVAYFVVSFVASFITIDRIQNEESSDKEIYLSTNGVHLDIVIPIENIDSLVFVGLKYSKHDKYLSFGWGDENFYINTPTWADLTFGNAFTAMFLQSSTLMHLTRYKQKNPAWVAVKVNESELQKLNSYLLNTFDSKDNGTKILLENKGYSPKDDFYKSKGSYSCFKTCNSWVNTGFKESGMKSSFWTPFDFGLMKKYE